MALCNIGTTILDELKLCYYANPSVIESLSKINTFKDGKDIVIYRSSDKNFRYHFTLFWGKNGFHDKEPFAKLYFSHYTEKDITEASEKDISAMYIYYRLENRTLYAESELRKAMSIPDRYHLEFHQFTHMEIAKDFKNSTVKLINKYMKDKSIATIINDEWIKDNNKLISAKEYRSRTLYRSKFTQLVISQKKAERNKQLGLRISAYNKLEEIKSNNYEKQYILDFYGNPKRSLHRLEISADSEHIKSYFKKKGIPPTANIIFDKDILEDMYYSLLSLVIRFSKLSINKNGTPRTRGQIPWEEILWHYQ